LVGTIALEFSGKPERRHFGSVIGVYVMPVARRLGAGAALVRAALTLARPRSELKLLRLTVNEGNAPAIALYESMGLSAWGVEPMAMCRTARRWMSGAGMPATSCFWHGRDGKTGASTRPGQPWPEPGRTLPWRRSM
jgi:RimJ/RimL family protein N-acetyltransferase